MVYFSRHKFCTHFLYVALTAIFTSEILFHIENESHTNVAYNWAFDESSVYIDAQLDGLWMMCYLLKLANETEYTQQNIQQQNNTKITAKSQSLSFLML